MAAKEERARFKCLDGFDCDPFICRVLLYQIDEKISRDCFARSLDLTEPKPAAATSIGAS